MPILKNETIHIRVSSKIKKQIDKKAEENGMNISDYLRLLIMQDLNKATK